MGGLFSRYTKVTLGLALTALFLVAGTVPAAHTVPQGSGIIDSRCDNHSCSQVLIDADNEPSNRLDTAPGVVAATPLYWGDQAVCLAGPVTLGCSAGDITSVQAGTGLTGGAAAGDATLAADFVASGGDGGTATTVARGDHVHDARYFTESELSTTGTINQAGNPVAWSRLQGVPGTLADGVDADSGGDVTAVTAGTGLSGGGTSGDLSLGADLSVLQARVADACVAGAAIRSIAQDGTVQCEGVDGDGGNADLLDGLDNAQFLRSDQSGTLTGSLAVTGALGVGTTDPQEALHAAGTVMSSRNGGPHLRLEDSTAPAKTWTVSAEGGSARRLSLGKELAAGTLAITPSRLPTSRGEVTAVSGGTYVYVFGGYNPGYLNQILRFEPASGAVAVMNAVLPSTRSEMAGVWSGDYAYLFGGYQPGSTDQILRYNPETDQVSLVGSLPSARHAAAAVWDPRDLPGSGCPGGCAYVFGGSGGGGQVVRFNPTNGVSLMGATLPAAVFRMSAVFDGQYAYVFGGTNGAVQYDSIWRYDPVADAGLLMTEVLPATRASTAAVWDGMHAYIFGGYGPSLSNQVLRYDPVGHQVDVMEAVLPAPRAYMGGAWDGTDAYLFGGYDPAYTDQILRFSPGTSSQPILSLTDTGRVGIGTTSPTQTLEVAGTVKATDYLTSITGNLGGIDNGQTKTLALPSEGAFLVTFTCRGGLVRVMTTYLVHYYGTGAGHQGITELMDTSNQGGSSATINASGIFTVTYLGSNTCDFTNLVATKLGSVI